MRFYGSNLGKDLHGEGDIQKNGSITNDRIWSKLIVPPHICDSRPFRSVCSQSVRTVRESSADAVLAGTSGKGVAAFAECFL